MRFLIVVILILGAFPGFSQEMESEVLPFEEYLGYVKKYHPLAMQAELIIDEGQAELMKARGGFDPKLEVDFDRKAFNNSTYYDRLNATFKIPTWYGIELQANFEQNEGDFLNPEALVPEDGLYSAGVSISLAQGLLINKRMAVLKQARFFREQAKSERDLAVNQVLYEAALSYFKWLQAFNEYEIYNQFLVNAQLRFNGIKKSVEVGERAAIDSVEAAIAYQNRQLNLEKSRLELLKARLEVSNFLWLENQIPVELQESVIPQISEDDQVDRALDISEFSQREFQIENHPKLLALENKYRSLEIDRRLKANMLLPRVDLKYNFLSETPRVSNSFNTANYKSAVRVAFPLFLRKERGNLKKAKLKLQDVKFEISATELQLINKINAVQSAITSYVTQTGLNNRMVENYRKMLTAEERKFGLGESSLFLVNSRETKLIEARLKAAALQNEYFSAKALLFNNLALNPDL
ncbi:MAG: TolC family protein [Flavobacteriaceae bacterium]|nr:TolC family protein [Bacteroidia bacterium]NNF74179.1 TolC family protein [Flavobacteriaceae bacterium]NNK73629.1 TolC family protein [Flavobacteriaceae bacterium]